MTHDSVIPEACQSALAALEQDPLLLSQQVQTHLKGCPACAEARIQWLALEEVSDPLAPAGYFEQLSERILRKLPPKRARLTIHPMLWAAAAVLLAAVGTGGFWLGRAHRAPLVEASTSKTELPDGFPEAPFHEGEDPLSQIQSLSQEETKALLDHMHSEPAP